METTEVKLVKGMPKSEYMKLYLKEYREKNKEYIKQKRQELKTIKGVSKDEYNKNYTQELREIKGTPKNEYMKNYMAKKQEIKGIPKDEYMRNYMKEYCKNHPEYSRRKTHSENYFKEYRLKKMEQKLNKIENVC